MASVSKYAAAAQMPRVFSAPLPASVFSSIRVLRRRQAPSRPAAAKARLKVTASLPTSSISTASARERRTASTVEPQSLQPSGRNVSWQIVPRHSSAYRRAERAVTRGHT